MIKLGPKNDEAAREALATWSGGLQVGGGITSENAQSWLEAGASKVSPASASPSAFGSGSMPVPPMNEGRLTITPR